MGKGPDEGCSWDIAGTFQTALAVCDDNIKDNDQITSYDRCMFFLGDFHQYCQNYHNQLWEYEIMREWNMSQFTSCFSAKNVVNLNTRDRERSQI